jgi:hypothetical protein
MVKFLLKQVEPEALKESPRGQLAPVAKCDPVGMAAPARADAFVL